MKSKDTASLVMPQGESYDGGQQNDTENETTTDEQTSDKTAGEGTPEEQAQEYYDEIMEVSPKVCKALYELLKKKYEGGEKTTKKEKASEKADTSSEGGEQTFDMKGTEY